MTNNGFKSYLNSKKWLETQSNFAVSSTSIYLIQEYVKISVGDDLKTSTKLSLKPGDTIKIVWIVENSKLVGDYIIFNNKKYNLYWKSEKIKKWVVKNCDPKPR
jgi:hypothetical protein